MSDVALGMVGLGTMGRNLLLNFADAGFSVAGFDRDREKIAVLREEADGRDLRPADSLAELVRALRRPRTVMLMVPAGAPVDSVLGELAPMLEAGDVVVDGGNSHFRDTDRRGEALAPRGLQYVGLGVSGGEMGARHGPSLMPGGPREAWERLRPLLEAAAAKVAGGPCVAYLGPRSAGHYVKMVHNGIEYGLLELIAEAYDFMRRGLGLGIDEARAVFEAWNGGELGSYLVEITAHILARRDGRTGNPLVDFIRDEAHQKGTGQWTSEEALDLGVPTPAIDVAVVMRHLSALKPIRERVGRAIAAHTLSLQGTTGELLEALRGALYCGMILTYAQGLSLLCVGSKAHGYGVPLDEVARIWRGGCIIRSRLLEPIRAVLRADPQIPTLMLDPALAWDLQSRQGDLRAVVSAASAIGIPISGFSMTLAYFDAMRSARLPANLIQAQRDYFGAHTYERVDASGAFHTDWEAP